MSNAIDSINQSTSASTGQTTATSRDDAMMGKDDFLMLLVAQLKNQDPLNPDEPTEFTAQLAQFSSLEQLFTLNEGMENLVASNTNSDRLSTLNTLGKEVAYLGSNFKFDGEPVELGYQLDGQASEVTLGIQLDGATIATLTPSNLSAGNHFITWDGLNNDGDPAPIGNYQIVLQAKANSGESVAAAPIVKAEVTGVDLDGDSGGTLLTTSGSVSFNEILGVYDPKTKPTSTASDKEEESSTILDTAEEVNETVDTVADITNDVKTLAE